MFVGTSKQQCFSHPDPSARPLQEQSKLNYRLSIAPKEVSKWSDNCELFRTTSNGTSTVGSPLFTSRRVPSSSAVGPRHRSVQARSQLSDSDFSDDNQQDSPSTVGLQRKVTNPFRLRQMARAKAAAEEGINQELSIGILSGALR